MYKQILSLLLIIALTAVVIVFMPQSKHVLEFLVSLHTYASNLLSDVFSGGNAGNIARGMVAMLAIPVLVGLVPSLLFFLVRKRWCPYFMEIVWILWLLQAGALIMTSGATSAVAT
jgi:hypothetical protein